MSAGFPWPSEQQQRNFRGKEILLPSRVLPDTNSVVVEQSQLIFLVFFILHTGEIIGRVSQARPNEIENFLQHTGDVFQLGSLEYQDIIEEKFVSRNRIIVTPEIGKDFPSNLIEILVHIPILGDGSHLLRMLNGQPNANSMP